MPGSHASALGPASGPELETLSNTLISFLISWNRLTLSQAAIFCLEQDQAAFTAHKQC